MCLSHKTQQRSTSGQRPLCPGARAELFPRAEFTQDLAMVLTALEDDRHVPHPLISLSHYSNGNEEGQTGCVALPCSQCSSTGAAGKEAHLVPFSFLVTFLSCVFLCFLYSPCCRGSPWLVPSTGRADTHTHIHTPQ